jgi:protein arginine N-methyltransferase 5
MPSLETAHGVATKAAKDNTSFSLEYLSAIMTSPIPSSSCLWVPVSPTQWRAWSDLHCATGWHGAIYPVLRLSAAQAWGTSAEGAVDEQMIRRWRGEQVKAVLIEAPRVKKGKGSVPLPKQSPLLAALSKAMVAIGAQCVLTVPAKADMPGARAAEFYGALVEEMRTWQPDTGGADAKESFEAPYHDVLQSPLQPLADHLESATYQVFEQDPVKYRLYREALVEALDVDKRIARDVVDTVVVFVVGAGRGPLVRATLAAAAVTKRNVRVYAVEKNPNAVHTLRHAAARDGWGDVVTILAGDMRATGPPERGHIIVSELLGSFGCNEASPECLDGAQELLLPDVGFSIPASYSSWAAPLCSSKLYTEARSFYIEDALGVAGHTGESGGRAPRRALETMYVVSIWNADVLTDSAELFSFDHPTPQPAANDRFSSVTFMSPYDTTITGFGGYFECVLYGTVHMSINPQSHSPGMFSWFPVYIPLHTPIGVKEGESVTLRMSRRSDGHTRKLWYEWTVSTSGGQTSALHNVGGRSHAVGL